METCNPQTTDHPLWCPKLSLLGSPVPNRNRCKQLIDRTKNTNIFTQTYKSIPSGLSKFDSLYLHIHNGVKRFSFRQPKFSSRLSIYMMSIFSFIYFNSIL